MGASFVAIVFLLIGYACLEFTKDPRERWVEACSPNEVRLCWKGRDYFEVEIVIDLEKRTIWGMADGNISHIRLYNHPELSTSQIKALNESLPLLPEGDHWLTGPRNGESELHVAFYQGGLATGAALSPR